MSDTKIIIKQTLKQQNEQLKKQNRKLKLKILHLTTFINRELRGFKSNHNKQIEEINKLENYEAMIDSLVSMQYDLEDSDSDIEEVILIKKSNN